MKDDRIEEVAKEINELSEVPGVNSIPSNFSDEEARATFQVARATILRGESPLATSINRELLVLEVLRSLAFAMLVLFIVVIYRTLKFEILLIAKQREPVKCEVAG